VARTRGQPPSGRFQIVIPDPHQEPIGPDDTELRAQILTQPARSDVNFSATLIAPNGHAESTHGTFDAHGSAVVILRIGGPGTYTLKVLAVSGSDRETETHSFEARVLAPQPLAILDGPGAGMLLHSTSRTSDPRPAVRPASPKYPYADASGFAEPAGRHCHVPAYHGVLFGHRDPRPHACGWGEVAYWTDGTVSLKYLSGAMTREVWTRHEIGVRPGIAFRGIEEANSFAQGVDTEIAREGASLRLNAFSTRVLREKMAEVNDHIGKAFYPLRRLFQGGAEPHDQATAIANVEAAIVLERYVLDSLKIHKLLLKSDAPEFAATVSGEFTGNTTSLNFRLHTEPPQEGAAYRVEVTQPNGRMTTSRGKLDRTGRATIAIATPQPNGYQVKAIVVGADPVTDIFSTSAGCPGRFQDTVAQTADGSYYSSGVVPIEDTFILPPCAGSGGQPTVSILDAASGQPLNVTNAKLSAPFQDVSGNQVYKYTASLDTGGRVIRFLGLITWP
jgi:hypothetical protein